MNPNTIAREIETMLAFGREPYLFSVPQILYLSMIDMTVDGEGPIEQRTLPVSFDPPYRLEENQNYRCVFMDGRFQIHLAYPSGDLMMEALREHPPTNADVTWEGVNARRTADMIHDALDEAGTFDLNAYTTDIDQIRETINGYLRAIRERTGLYETTDGIYEQWLANARL